MYSIVSPSETWSDLGLLGGFGASVSRNPVFQPGSTALVPCVYTFSKNYETSKPYFPGVNENDSLRLDSTFLPDPPDSWFGFGNSSSFNPPILALDYFQTAPWFRLAIDPSASQSDIENLGSRRKAQGLENPVALGGIEIVSNATNSSASTFSTGSKFAFASAIENLVSSSCNASNWSGLLGNIDTSLFMNLSVNDTEFLNFVGPLNHTNDVRNSFTIANFSLIGLNLTIIQPLPWFDLSGSISDNDLDDQISSVI